ncbi:outer membrane usher protein [Tahibacter aquaticus]|uniref:Outer membrane usher protein n=1 Tax=Tahibacter aquaticus TaxID=520092 RepID=A0A4V3DLX3_9GAMM|nr:fimbria/pilus outer membrane usher protein [Tahibacter aquaticus]TDR41552.1 outer membrane usher protein [Tahibacter aquaticus]
MRAWSWWMFLELALAAPALAAPEPGPEAGDIVVYDVVLQDRTTGKVDEFRRVGDALYAPRALLQELGLPLPAGSGEWVDLRGVAGLAVTVDEARQQLSLRLAAGLRPLTVLYFPDQAAAPAQKLAPGLSLGYAFSQQRSGSDTATAARFTPRLFGPFGVFSHDTLYNSEDQPRWRRIDSYWQQDFPAQARQLRIGDAIAPGLAWSRAWRYGGVHFGSDYSLRPDLITYPLPGFRGEAAVPSALDIVVNGLRTPQGQVPDGPFAIPRLPLISGGGEALVVMTDALGREQVSRVPFYVSTHLLRAGLSDFSLDAGRLRRGFGDRYTRGFAALSARHGFSDSLTLETQAQAGDGLRSAGMGLVTRVGQAGAVQLAVSRSQGGTCAGSQLYLASEWQRGWFSARSVQQWKRDEFCDLAALEGSALPRRQSQFSLGVATAIGQFNLSRIARREDDGSALLLESASWSQRLLERAWLSLAVQRLRESGKDNDSAVQLNLLLPLDDAGTSLAFDGISGARDRRIASLQRPAPAGLGWGYRLESALERSDLRVAAEWRTRNADLSLEADYSSSGTAVRAGAEGALVWLDGQLFATRRLGDAFAVVDTAGVANLPIQRENQWQGRSNAQGRFLVTELRPYEANRIGYDARELPAQVQGDTDWRLLYPYRGGGIRADLGLRRSPAQALQLRLADGSLAPLGAQVLLDGRALQSVGYDGLVQLPPPTPRQRWQLRGSFGECTLRSVAPAQLQCETGR